MMKISGASSVTALSLVLCACGGGGDSSPTVVHVSQTEAADVAQEAASAQYVAFNSQTLASYALSEIASVRYTGSSSATGISCSNGGTYSKTWNKVSAPNYLGTGDTITLTYYACNDGAMSITGGVTYTVTSLTGTAANPSWTSSVLPNNAALSVPGVSGTVLLNTGFFHTYANVRANVYSSATASSSTFTGRLSDFSSSASVVNGNYSLNSMSTSRTLDLSTATTKFSEGFAFGTPYIGTDGNTFNLALATNTNVQTAIAGASLTITTPGLFTITGYKGSTIRLTNNSLTSSTVSVDDASDGAIDLTFTLPGTYML